MKKLITDRRISMTDSIQKELQGLYDYFEKRYEVKERRFLENDSMKYYGEANAYSDAGHKVYRLAQSLGLELITDEDDD